VSDHTSVLPDGGNTTVVNHATGQRVEFTLTNSAPYADQYTITCAISDRVTSCVPDTDWIDVPANSTVVIGVTFSVGLAGTGTLSLTATSDNLIEGGPNPEQDTGDYHVTVDYSAIYSVSVTPDASNDSLQITEERDVEFDVHNLGNVTVTINLSCGTSSLVTCVTVYPSSVILGAWTDVRVKATVVGGSTQGSGYVTVNAQISGTDASDTGRRDFIVWKPNSFAAYFTASSRHDRSRCVTTTILGGAAMQCGDLLYAHSLPAYRSHGRSRALTLLYNSQTVKPLVVAEADFTTWPGEQLPASLRLDVIVNGATVATATYSNSAINTAIRQVHRLALAIDAVAQNLGTGAHNATIQLTVNRSPVETYSTTTRLVVVDRRLSPFGAGWWVAGVERVYSQSDGALVVYGDGSAVFFSKVGGNYVPPPGVYDSLFVVGSHFERRTDDRRVTVVYGTNGPDSLIRDTHGNVARHVWSSNPSLNDWKLDSIVDAGGRATTFAYTSGYLTSVNQPATNAVGVTQTSGRITQINDPDNFATTFGYDGNARMTTYTGRRLGLVTLFYNATVSRLDSAMLPISQGKIHRVLFTVPEREGLAANGATSAALGSADRAHLAIIRPREVGGQVPRDSAWFTVDGFGAPTFATDPMGIGTVIERDTLSQPVHVISAATGEAWQTWASGLLQRVVRASDTSATARDTTVYGYDMTWRSVSRIVNPEKDSTRFQYDGVTGDRIRVIGGASDTTRFYYNSRGQLDSIVEPNGTTAARYTYGSSVYFNLTSIATPAGTTQYSYAANASDVSQVQSPSGLVTAYTYDGIKRVTQTTQSGAGAPTRTVGYSFDDVAKTTTLTDPLNHTTTWRFDALGRDTSRTGAGYTEYHTYGDRWNLTSVKTRRGYTITMQYDAAGRLLVRSVPAAGFAPARVDTLAYDEAGNVIRARNGFARVSRSYNRRGLLSWEQMEIRSWNLINYAYEWYKVSRAHRYDRNGRRRASFYTPPTGYYQPCVPVPDDPTCDGDFHPVYGDSIRYHYEGRGLLDSIVNTLWKIDGTAQNTAWRFHYDRNGRLDTLRVPKPSGSGYLSFDYDAAGRVTYYQIAGLGADRNTTSSYEPVTGWVASVLGGPGGQRYYTHDPFGQILTEGTGQGQDDINRYSYDAAGNRLTERNWTYNYDVGNGRLTSRVSGGETIGYNHDASGNSWKQTHNTGCRGSGDVERSLIYSADERPVSTKRWLNIPFQGCQQEDREYWYDALGRLVLSRSLNQWSADWGVTRFWWLDEEIAVRHRNTLSEPDLYVPKLVRDDQGVLTAIGEWYYPGPGTDNALASFNYQVSPGLGTGHRHLFLRDWRGSVVTVVEHSGGVHNQAEYDAFGSADGEVAAAGPGYNGAPSIEGFQYLRNRWYDPTIGRFTQEDPIGFVGGINLYAYAGSNPVSFSDPYGLCPPDNHSVSDCPDDTLGNAWRKLSESEAGRGVIDDYVRVKPNVDTDVSSCGIGRHCTDRDLRGVHVSGNVQQTALGLTHESVHVTGTAPPVGSQEHLKEERAAWQRVFQVYDAFSRTDRDSTPDYGALRDFWGRNPRGFDSSLTCGVLVPRPPNCN
jgi:RHS repeat-associated protein